MSNITLRDLLAAGAHFGHQTRYWNPKMAPYIFGVKHKIHIINLEKTLEFYKDAVNFLSNVASKRGKILFVGTKIAAQKTIQEEAERCSMPYVNIRWLGGMLTNYKTVRQSIKHLKDMEAIRDSEEFAKFSKKEALQFMRELAKLERGLKGIKDMSGLPDAIFIIDVGHEKIAVTEANKLKIPVVGIVDTNRDPSNIDYVIPGNDDSEAAIKLYVKYIADAIVEARSALPIEEVVMQKEGIKRPQKKAPKSRKKVFTKNARTVVQQNRKPGAAPEIKHGQAAKSEPEVPLSAPEARVETETKSEPPSESQPTNQ